MLPKRGFLMASMHFSMNRRPNRVLTPAEKWFETTHRTFRSAIENLRLGSIKLDLGYESRRIHLGVHRFHLQVAFRQGNVQLRNSQLDDSEQCRTMSLSSLHRRFRSCDSDRHTHKGRRTTSSSVETQNVAWATLAQGAINSAPLVVQSNH